jgi:hypothetical protein
MKDPLAGASWFKSSRSSGEGGACVEVAVGDGVVGVRDSKDQAGPVLVVTPDAWEALIRDIKDGKLDLG